MNRPGWEEIAYPSAGDRVDLKIELKRDIPVRSLMVLARDKKPRVIAASKMIDAAEELAFDHFLVHVVNKLVQTNTVDQHQIEGLVEISMGLKRRGIDPLRAPLACPACRAVQQDAVRNRIFAPGVRGDWLKNSDDRPSCVAQDLCVTCFKDVRKTLDDGKNRSMKFEEDYGADPMKMIAGGKTQPGTGSDLVLALILVAGYEKTKQALNQKIRQITT